MTTIQRSLRRVAAQPRTIRYSITDSRLGRILLAATDRGICALRFGDDDETLKQDFLSSYRLANFDREDQSLRPWLDQIALHLEGRQPELDLPLDLSGTPFQERVWQELRAIPYGCTRSYGEVARAIGRPKAMRAVGQACGRNPVPIIVPCHRVLRGHGQLGGFSAGLDRKRFLLDLEKTSTWRQVS